MVKIIDKNEERIQPTDEKPSIVVRDKHVDRVKSVDAEIGSTAVGIVEWVETGDDYAVIHYG